MDHTRIRLRELSPVVRLGLGGMVLVLLGGLAASAAFIYQHYAPRDSRPGLSMDDFRGAYHGVSAPAPLVAALERGHPETLGRAERDALMDWLLGRKDPAGRRPVNGNARLAEDYDSIDLGDLAPQEVIARDCLRCHAAQLAQGSAAPALDSWERVKKVAFGKDISPTPVPLLVVSTHAHALSLGTLGVVAAALGLASSLPRRLVHGLIGVMGVGLLADLGSWWVARLWSDAVYVIVAGGAAFNVATATLLLLILADLWLPRRG
jgi:hypothetical protein